MVETHEYRGYWWLPSDEPSKLSGTLTVTRGDAKLDVLGHFGRELLDRSEKEEVYSIAPASQSRIFGITTAGKRVTLETCTLGNSTISYPGIPTTTYRPRIVLLGVWFTEGEEVSFDEIAIRTSELDTWTCVSGFSGGVRTEEQPDTGHVIATAYDIHFEPPPSIVIPLDDGDEARIDFAYQVKPGTTEANVSQEASLFLRYAKLRCLEEVFASVGQVRDFLSLAVGQPVTVLSVTGFRDELLETGSTSRQSVQVLWEIPHNPEPTRRPRHTIEMLFTLPEVEPIISKVMRAWFSRYEVLGPVFNLYFGMLYHRDMYSDVRFLSYAQAIETYDFRRRDVKLARGNRLTLRKRVHDVINKCPSVRDKIAGTTSPEQNGFVSSFVNSRNYYTHYNPDLEEKAASGVALLLLTVQLRTIIEMSLLRELGFSCDAIDNILSRIQRYTEISNLKSIVAEEEQSAGTQNKDSATNSE